MKIIYNKEAAQEYKTKFEEILNLKSKVMLLERKSALYDAIGWSFPLIAISFLAISYGAFAGRTAIAILLVLMNLIVPTFKVIDKVQDYYLFKSFLKSGFEKEIFPPLVLYCKALETSNDVQLTLEYETPINPNSKCKVFLNNDTKDLIGEFNIMIDPEVQEETVELETEIVYIPAHEEET